MSKETPRGGEWICRCGHTDRQHLDREHCYTVCEVEGCPCRNAHYRYDDGTPIRGVTKSWRWSSTERQWRAR